MRIAVGGISHETNTFSTIKTDLTLFERRGVHSAEALLPAFAGTKTIVGGFIDSARSEGFEVVPTMLAEAAPSGTVTAEAFDRLTTMLLDGLRDAGPLDGVLLELHGAMVAERAGDGDAEILRRVRALVGSIPIVAVLDLHANISDGMVALADALVGYDTYPHIDMYSRGLEAGAIVHRMVAHGLRTARALRKPPLLPPLPKQCTSYDTPMRALIELAHELEGQPGMVAVTVAAGFPYADVPEAGLAVLAISEGDQSLADRVADEVAALAWARRQEFVVQCTPVEDALDIAVSHPADAGGPVLLADTADNPGAGSPCDGTILLRGLLQRGVQQAAVGAIWDPAAVKVCQKAGVGETVTLDLGGKVDALHGAPLTVTGRVRLLTDGSFVNLGPMNAGAETRMGPTAVLAIDGVDVIVTSNRVQALDAGMFRSQGIDPGRKRVLVLKSSVHYRGAFEPLASRVVEVDTPGLSNSDLSRFRYQHVRRPIFPLDPME
ncbi:MAG: M81 family metallopeptidase [Chloroflexi bacterium]|nr:M81 family metallopeptidase [Chloroflexota bacterium]